MKADLSRTTFNRFKRFSRVVAQQGRVQLDADWNEQSSIMLYQLRRLAADIIGPAGGPADSRLRLHSPRGADRQGGRLRNQRRALLC